MWIEVFMIGVVVIFSTSDQESLENNAILGSSAKSGGLGGLVKLVKIAKFLASPRSYRQHLAQSLHTGP